MLTAAKIASKKKPKKPKLWTSQKKIFNCELRELRVQLGLTMRDVSKCGVCLATIARAEQGFEIELSHAIMLAKFFEKPIEEIWRE